MTPGARDARWNHLANLTAGAYAHRAALLATTDAVIPHLDDAGAYWRDLLDNLDLTITNDDDLYPFVAGMTAFSGIITERHPALADVVLETLLLAATGLTDHLPK